MRPRPDRSRGFSLLELMVAMAVMAMSLALLYQVDAGVLRGLGDQSQAQRASLLAQSLLDARDAVPAAGWNEQGQAAGFDWQVDSTALPLAPGLDANTPPLHEVRIAVSWPGRLGRKSLQISTQLPQAMPEAGAKAP